MGFYEEGLAVNDGRDLVRNRECNSAIKGPRIVRRIEQRSSFYGPLSGEGLGLWEAVPAAQVHRGSSGDQTHGGACRMERLVLSEDIPDRLGQLAGEIDPGDLGATLATEPRLGALVSIAIATIPGGVGGGLDQGPAKVRRAVLGQWPAPVLAPGLTNERAQPGCIPRASWGWRSG